MNGQKPSVSSFSVMTLFAISAAVVLVTLLPAAVALGAQQAERAGVFISEARLARLKARVQDKVEPTYTAYLALQKRMDAIIDREPKAPQRWYVPGYYKDARGHRDAKEGLHDDANEAYGLALMYRMTGDPKYAKAAVRFIDAWSSVGEFEMEDDSTLSFSYHFPAMIFAADLLRDDTAVWPAESQARFETFLREKALPMNTMHVANNWGNWGALLVMSIASYLDDEELVAQAVDRWKHFIEEQIAVEGYLKHEVNRQRLGDRGIWYSHFSLMPQTISAEVARLRGIELYDYESPSGRSLRLAFETLAPWARDPRKFPFYKGEEPAETGQHRTDYVSYWEILNERWPNADATAMLEEMRPLSADHSAPYLTFTHGEMLKP